MIISQILRTSLFSVLFLHALTVSTVSAADPTILLLTPDTGISATDFNTNNTTPTVSGIADPGSSVQLFIGPNAGALIAVGAPVVAAAGVGTYAIALPAQAQGIYVIQARATPAVGPVAVSLNKQLVVDTTSLPPTGLAFTPQVGASGFTNTTTPTITGTADLGASVTISINGTIAGKVVASAVDGSFSFITPSLVEGSFSVTATQLDVAGNVASGASAALPLSVDLRTTKPLVYTSTVGGSGSVTNNANPGFNGKAEPGATIELHTSTDAGPVVGSAIASGSGLWSVASLSSSLAEGANTIVAVATDNGGNSLNADNFTLTVDTIPPTSFVATGFINTIGGAAVTSPTTIRTLAWTGTVVGATGVNVSLDGVAAGSASLVAGVWTYTFLASLPDHTYVFVATASDAAGNAATPVSDSITVLDPSSTAAEQFTPSILNSLTSGSTTTNSSTVGLSFVGQPSAAISVDFVVVTAGVAVAPQVTSLNASGSLAYTTPVLADGTYDVTVTDIVEGLSSAAYRLIIDTVPPTGPTTVVVSDDSGISATDLITNDATPRLDFSVMADAAPSSDGLRVTATIDGNSFGSAAVVAGIASITAPFTLPDGSYVLSFGLRDAAGNVSTTVLANKTLIIDTVSDAPLKIGITPDTGRLSDDRITNQGTALTLIGRAEANATVAVTITGPGAAVGFPVTTSATVNGAGVWTLFPLPTISVDGAYSFSAVATDIAGNISAASGGLILTYDSTAPVTTITGFSPNTGSGADNRTNATTIVIAGTSEADADVVVTLSSGATTTVRANGSGAWTATFSGLADGSYNVSAISTDAAGNTGVVVNAPALFVIDTVVAVPTIASITVDSIGAAVGYVAPVTWATDFITSDQTLVYNGGFTGAVVATDSFELLLGATVISTQTPSGGATTWTFDNTAATQAPATYTIRARLTDDVGNVASDTQQLRVDIAIPTAVISSIGPDTGISSTDFITSATTLTSLQGTSSDGSGRNGFVRVEVRLAGVDQFPSPVFVTINSGTNPSNWSVPSATLATISPTLIGTPATTYQIVVTPTDAAGNLGAAVTQNVIIDTVPPVVGATATIDSFSVSSGSATGASSGSITSDTTPTLIGSSFGFSAGGFVTIYSDLAATVVLGTALLDGSGNWTFTSPARADGLTSYFAKVFDAAGNAASLVSSGFDITIDTVSPTASIVSITDDTAGGTGTTGDFITKDTQLSLSGTASDLHLTNATGVTLSLSGGIFTNLVPTFVGSVWTLDRTAAPVIPDGSYTLTLTVTDDVNNSTTRTQTIVIDTQVIAPVPALAPVSDTGTLNNDRVTKDNTPTMTGTAEPDAAVTVVFTPTSGPAVTVTVFADNSGNWSATPSTALVDSVYTVTTTQVDRAGNGPSVAATTTITVDTAVPASITVDLIAASDTGSSNGDNVTADNTPTFTAVGASVAEPNAQVTLTFIQSGSPTVTQTVTADAFGVWTATAPVLADGTWTVIAQQTDLAGNGLSLQVILAPSLVIDLTPPAAPTLDLAAASDSGTSATDNRTNDTTPTFTATAEPNAVVTVTFTQGATVVTTTVTADSTGAYTATAPSALADGAWVVTATQIDLAGNGPSAGVTLAPGLVIDTAAPAAPVITAIGSDTGSSASDFITNDQTLAVTGTVEPGALVTVFIGGVLQGTALADGTGAWSFAVVSTLAEGVYALTTTATDVAGNTGALSAPTSVTIDLTTPPVPTIDLVAASDSGTSSTDNLTSDTTPTFTATAEPNAKVTLTFTQGATIVTTTVDANGAGAWTATAPSALGDGPWVVTAAQRDLAGNGLSVPVTLAPSLVIDTATPAAPTIDVVAASDSGTSNTDNQTNDTTPTLTATAEPSAVVTVTFTQGATVVTTTVTADGTGAWTATAPAVLGDGAWVVTATQTDLAGNGPSVAATLVPGLVIDTSVPLAPAIDLAGASDSGTSNADNQTSDTTPTFTSTAEPNAQVTVTFTGPGGPVVVTVTADSSGDWIATPPSALTDGSWTVTATQTDLAGNGPSPLVTLAPGLVIDTTAPPAPVITTMIGDTGSSGTDRITNDQTQIISGTAEPGSRVEVFIDGVSQGTALADGTGAWSFGPTAAIAEGVHAVTTQATDVAGNVGVLSAGTSLTIDLTIPAAPTLDLAAASDSGTSATDNRTNDTTPTFTATAEPSAVVTVTFTQGATVVTTTVTADSTGAYTATAPSALVDGAWVVTATQIDLAGNGPSAGVTLAPGLVIDTSAPAAPVITAIGSDTGSSASDFITNDQTLVVTGTVEPGALVTVFIGGVLQGTALADGTGAWSFAVVSTLAEGVYALTTTATDVAGNTGALSAPTSVTIDLTLPLVPTLDLATASDSGRSDTDHETSEVTPTFEGTAEPNARVTVSLTKPGSPTVTLVVDADNAGVWTATVPLLAALADGTWTVVAQQKDLAGNGPSVSVTLNPVLLIDTVKPVKPVITVIADDRGSSVTDGITNDQELEISGTAEANAQVEIFFDGTSQGTVLTDASGNWTFGPSVTLAEGTYVITAEATDVAGNTSDPSDDSVVTVDVTTPAAPTISLDAASDTGISSTDHVTNDTTPTVSSTAEPFARVTVTFVKGADTLTVTVDADSAGAWSVTAPAVLTDGTWIVSARQTDLAGNGPSVVGVLAPALVIDTTASVAITSLSPGAFTGTATALTASGAPTVGGTTDPGATVTVSVAGSVVGSVVASGTGAWSFPLSGLTDGVFAVVATAVDIAGNTAPAVTVTLTVDLTAPLHVVITGLTADGVSVPNGGDSADETPTLLGTAEANSTVEIYADGVLLGTTVALSDGTWSFTVPTPFEQDQTVVFTAVSIDAAGNQSAVSAPWTTNILQTRELKIEPEKCGTGSNFALFTLLMFGLLGFSFRRPRNPSGLLMVVALMLPGMSMYAVEEVRPVPVVAPVETSVVVPEEEMEVVAPEVRVIAPVPVPAEPVKVPEVQVAVPVPVVVSPRLEVETSAIRATAPFRFGAKWEAPPRISKPQPLIPNEEWWDLRVLVGSMPEPDQEASYLSAGLEPGESSWQQFPRIDVQGMFSDRRFGWSGLVYGAGLGWFKLTGDEAPPSITTNAFDYRINTVPFDLTAGVRIDVDETWWFEGRGILGAGPSFFAIDTSGAEAGNLESTSGSTVGLYTEYGVVGGLYGRFGQWEAGCEGRLMQGRHSAAFEQKESINGNQVASENYEVRLDQTGFSFMVMCGRRF